MDEEAEVKVPDADALQLVTITIGPDGRVYFHDLPSELLPVALALAPQDEQLQARAALVAGPGLESR